MQWRSKKKESKTETTREILERWENYNIENKINLFLVGVAIKILPRLSDSFVWEML